MSSLNVARIVPGVVGVPEAALDHVGVEAATLSQRALKYSIKHSDKKKVKGRCVNFSKVYQRIITRPLQEKNDSTWKQRLSDLLK